MKIFIGKGVLSWPKGERVSDRYGTIMLMGKGMNSLSRREDPIEFVNRPPENIKAKLFAVIIENRESTHIGDFFKCHFPSKPDVGERIDFGEGLLFYSMFNSYPLVGLKPLDGRTSNWLNPKSLYRAHEQTVDLFCEYENGTKEEKEK